MECALDVPSCNGCLNAIRCWIGRSGRVADIAGSGFNLNVYSQLRTGAPLLFSKMVELKGYALGNLQGQRGPWRRQLDQVCGRTSVELPSAQYDAANE